MATGKLASLVLGIALTVGGLFGFIGLAGKEHPFDQPGAPLGAFILLMFFLGGVALARGALGKSSLSAAQLEQAVLESARRRRGRITVTELTLDVQCDTLTAQRALDAMVAARVAELEIGDTGLVIYVFRAFEREAESATNTAQKSTTHIATSS